jgi:dTMP kinase
LENRFSGKFIVLDGPDGCGKSTQCELLGRWLSESNVDVEIFRDPGGTAIGEKIRQILLNPEHAAMSTRAELLLYMAARAQLWQEKIAPSLQANKCVILDRWLSSTCAYQGWAGGFGMGKIIAMAKDCLERPWPDLTVILDIDLETASRRLNRPLDRMEQKGDGYHKKVREGFLKLSGQQKHIILIDATDNVETVHKKVIETLGRI